jgi:hypothetical protein
MCPQEPRRPCLCREQPNSHRQPQNYTHCCQTSPELSKPQSHKTMMLTPESGQQYALPALPMMSDGTNTTKTATDGHKKFPRVSRRTKTTSPLPRATQKSQMTPKLSTPLWMAVRSPQLANNVQWHRCHHGSNRQPQKWPVCTRDRKDGRAVTEIDPEGAEDPKTFHTALA